MSRMKRLLSVFVAFTMVGAVAVGAASSVSSSASPKTAAAAPGSQWTKSHPFKAAFIYVGAPSDAGWTHAHDVARLEVQSYFGGRVQTMYKEDVPEGPQCAQVITQLVDAGANIIFTRLSLPRKLTSVSNSMRRSPAYR